MRRSVVACATVLSLTLAPFVAIAEVSPVSGAGIGAGCADIWAAKSPEELKTVSTQLFAALDQQIKDLQIPLDDAKGDYENTKVDYALAHTLATKALTRLASSAVDAGIHEALKKEEASPSGGGLLDQLVDTVAKTDGQSLTNMAKVGVNDAATDALLKDQAKAEQAMLAAYKKVLVIQSKLNALTFARNAITSCQHDQEEYLASNGPSSGSSEPVAQPTLPESGGYRMDVQFSGAPSRTFDMPADQAADIPYSPAGCHDACMAEPQVCVAWNYTYNSTASGYPPAHCSLYEGAAPGSSISKGGFSGFGPKAIGLGLATK